MKEIIKEIMDNQGLSLGGFCDKYNIKRNKIESIFYYNKNNLSDFEINTIKNLRLIKPNKIKYINKGLIDINQLNVKNIFPSKTRYGFDIHFKELNNNYLEFWYQPKMRGKISLILPSKIKLNEKFFINLGLSIGDGLNNPCKRNTHYNFCNKNFDLVRYNHLWLRDVFKIKNIEFYLYVPIKNINEIEDYKKKISFKFDINGNKIKVYNSNRHKYPALTLQVSNSLFQHFYLNLFKKLRKTILKETIFRRAFLRGLFAAEGHVKHSTYGTIESISFAFDPKREIELIEFVKKSLDKERIKNKINNKSGTLYFCGYENMIKFFLLGIIDLYKEKRNKFIRLIRNAKITINFKDYPLNKINLSQNKIARIFNISQPAISLMYKYKRLKISNLKKVRNLIGIEKYLSLKNIKSVTVGTNIIKDKEVIKSLISLQS